MTAPLEIPNTPNCTVAPIGRTDRLQKLTSENYQFVWRTLRRLGLPSALADDAAQDVFVIATQKLDQIWEGAERSFLFQTALRRAMAVRRDRAQLKEVGEEPLETEMDCAPQPCQSTEDAQLRQQLDQVLDALPEDLRTVFILFELEELSMIEISELIDIPQGTVASRLRRARALFQNSAQRYKAMLQRGAQK